jgi:hypothetical protein
VNQQAGNTIEVVCTCGKKLKAPASAVGRKARCPKCQNVLTVKPPPPPKSSAAEDDPFDALYDLAAASEQAAQAQEFAPRCPNCRGEMSPGAVLCTNCGFDTRTGKSIAAKAAAAAPKVSGTRYDPAKAAAAAEAARKNKNAGTDKMAPQASYWKGLAACAGGAAIGGIVWFLIAYFTGYEVYYVLLLVAVLAGVGMQWGQQGYSYLGGFTAAGMTFLTMVLARLAVVVALLIPMMHRDAAKKVADREAARMPDLTMYDERVVDELYAEQIKLQPKPAKADKTASADSSDEDEDFDADADVEGDEKPRKLSPSELREIAAYQAVEKKLKAMPKPQYDAMLARLKREERDSNLEGLLTEDILLRELGYHPSRAGQVLTRQANGSAKERIAKMSEAERDATYKRLNAEAEAEHEKRMAEMRAEMKKRHDSGEDGMSSGAVAAVTGIVIFFLVFGGIKGAFWTCVALALAYRTASGSVTSS